MSHKPLPFEFLELLVRFADKAVELTNCSHYDALTKFTNLPRLLNLPHTALSDDPVLLELQKIINNGESTQMANRIYDLYVARLAVDFPDSEHLAVGCFRLTLPDSAGLCRVHLSPSGTTDLHPLARENRAHRIDELAELFATAKREFGDTAITVGGFSWLYNIPAYTSLFPVEYAASGVARPEWLGSLAKWGQFITAYKHLRGDMTTEFLVKVRASTTMYELLDSFKYQTLETRAPIQAFYDFYRV